MADSNLKSGQTVQTQDGRQGIIRYIGSLHIAAGNWCGLELSDNSGKNDGSVKGERYFQCQPGHGIFVRKESVVKVLKQPAAVVTSKANGTSTASNGTATRPRPSSGMAAEVARKRQSLMSAGSGSTPGSRLSIRSPTKSPTKPVHSSTSSAASTPRTSTPATTARTSDSSTKSRLSMSSKPSMPPPPTTRASAPSARLSMSGTAPKSAMSRPTTTQPRQSLSGSRLSLQPKPSPRPVKPASKDPEAEQPLQSPTAEEEAKDGDVQHAIENREEEQFEEDNDNIHHEEKSPIRTQSQAQPSPEMQDDVTLPGTRPRKTSISRGTTNGSVESRTAQKREVEQLKATIRSLEKKIVENREKVKAVDGLQADKDRYEGIIQALQKKMKGNQQEMSDMKAKLEEAASRAGQVDNRSAEHESELELATLDKEMADERAEMFQAELEALKVKFEELELEAEILREENRELSTDMSPEERAGAGWLQMEREQERLRQALILLRDVTQQTESDLKTEIKELQDNLEESEQTSSKYDEVAERLGRAEETNKHLMEQLEAVETNDEVVEAMEAQREQNQSLIDQLKKQIQELEEHIQVTDELESFHIEEEKRLHYQLDESDAMLNERHRHSIEQERAIEDLEYTLSKFRDVVQGLQQDIDELRRSRDISELEASEMSSKSRAMMDLNLQLQNSAAKSQMKAIDVEMGKMRAEQASLHLEIVQLFVPETFENERNPVLALLCFRRIKSKASLVKNLLAERMRDRPHLAQDDPFMVFEVIEKMNIMACYSERFIQFMSSCSTQDFALFSGSLFELEPVERVITGWIEALRRDEMSVDGPEPLQRIMAILIDMAEKLIPDTIENKATELLSQIGTTEAYADSIANQLAVLVRYVQSKLGAPKDEDEESQVFDKKMDQFVSKARTTKYLCGKVSHSLHELRSGSMCVGETTWLFFEDTEKSASQLSQLVRAVAHPVLEEINDIDREQDLSYARIAEIMISALQKSYQSSNPRANRPDDVFLALADRLQSIQTKVDDLTSKASDISSALEFEKQPSPWIIRAKEIKAQKIVSQDVQEEMTRLKTKSQELVLQIGEKDKQLEEQQIRVELLESRSKEVKLRDENVKAMKDEIENLRNEKNEAVKALEKIESDFNQMIQSHENEKTTLEASRKVSLPTEDGIIGVRVVDEAISSQYKVEIDMLNAELTSLQAAVRYLKAENKALRLPPGEIALRGAQYAWLDPSTLSQKKVDARLQRLKSESTDVFAGLIELAKASKPVSLKAKATTQESGKASWRSTKETTRYQILRQKEELEKWSEWKTDLLKRARLASHGVGLSKSTAYKEFRTRDLLGLDVDGNKMPGSKQAPQVSKIALERAIDGVHILDDTR